jgi:hypothetical protein
MTAWDISLVVNRKSNFLCIAARAALVIIRWHLSSYMPEPRILRNAPPTPHKKFMVGGRSVQAVMPSPHHLKFLPHGFP